MARRRRSARGLTFGSSTAARLVIAKPAAAGPAIVAALASAVITTDVFAASLAVG